MSSLVSVNIIPVTMPVTADVVSVDEARTYAALGENFTDDFIKVLIAEARILLEKYTCQVFLPSNVTSTYKQYGSGDCIILGYCNGIDVNTIDGLPTDSELEGDGDQWYLNTTAKKVKLSYQAGYETVPENIKIAVLKQVAWDTMHFGDELSGDVCPEAKILLSQFTAHIWE